MEGKEEATLAFELLDYSFNLNNIIAIQIWKSGLRGISFHVLLLKFSSSSLSTTFNI